MLLKCLEEGMFYVYLFSCFCMGCNIEGEIYWCDVGIFDSFW